MTSPFPGSSVRTRLLEAKSLVRKLLGLPDPWKDFRRFQAHIHPETWSRQPEILDWLATAPQPTQSDSARVIRAMGLRAEVLAAFRDRWRPDSGWWRVLIHLPDFGISPAGHSLYRNLGAGLAWIGVPVDYWETGTPLAPHLREFEPTVLLSIDHVWFALNISRDDPDAADAHAYRKAHRLVLGLASNHGPTDSGALARHFDLARGLGVDFFYSFQCPEFVAARYRSYADNGFPVASLEFGANPLVYYPLPGVPRDLDYVFLASANAEKWSRYFDYLSRPLARHPGVILGPGWSRAAAVSVPDFQANRLYARARIGLNLHVPFQIAEPTELNERAYNLAASGTPQLIDRPALLPVRFSDRAVFVADTPEQYSELFAYMLAHPDEAAERGLRSLEEILTGHTIFHRADSLLRFISDRFHRP